MHTDMSVFGNKKRTSASPELELQVIVSWLLWWVLGTEPMSYEEQCVLLITKLPLQLLFYVFYLNVFFKQTNSNL